MLFFGFAKLQDLNLLGILLLPRGLVHEGLKSISNIERKKNPSLLACELV